MIKVPSIDNLLKECRVDTFRASGKGGQHVNKVESAIRLTHHPTGIIITCQDERSQYRNKEIAVRRLHKKLMELNQKPKKRIPTLNDLTSEDANLIGKLFQIAKQMAKKLNIDESGYRAIFNCNNDGGQTVYHIHLHLIGGRLLNWPPG